MLTEYSVGVGTGQADRLSNIGWRWCRIRRKLTEYSVGVGTGQADRLSNIGWRCCRIERTTMQYLVRVRLAGYPL